MFIHNMFCACGKARALMLVVVIVAALWSAFFVYAQVETTPAISEKESAALRELGQTIGQEISTVEEARVMCNREQYISTCVEVGKKHGLYKPDELKQVDQLMEEAKGAIISDLQKCQDEQCLLDAAKRLTERIATRKPELAKQVDLTPVAMEKKEKMMQAAKEVGVSFGDCQNMDPDTASVELLRACARLAKDERVKTQLSATAKEQADKREQSVEIMVDLRTQRLACGDGTIEGCGKFCLNPGPEARTKGVEGIPPICREIANKIYGKEGTKKLEAAYEQVGQVENFLKKQAENIVFITSDGKKLYDPKSIGQYLEEEGRRGNVEAVQKGMDFLLAYGFVTQEDKSFALKMVQTIREKGREVNFDKCKVDPNACKDFVPQEFKQEFTTMDKVYNILVGELQKEGVPNPQYCGGNPEYGEGCLKAAKNALPLIEELSAYPEVASVLKEIKTRIEEGQKGIEAREKAKKVFEERGGEFTAAGRRFTNVDELQKFCSINGSLCLAEAARQGIIEKDAAKEKLTKSYETQYQYQPMANIGQYGEQPLGNQIFQFNPYAMNRIMAPMMPTQITMPAQMVQQGPMMTQGVYDKERMLKEFEAWLNNPTGAMPISVMMSQGTGQQCGQGYCGMGDYCADPGRSRCCPQGENLCPDGRCVRGSCTAQQYQEPYPQPSQQLPCPSGMVSCPDGRCEQDPTRCSMQSQYQQPYQTTTYKPSSGEVEMVFSLQVVTCLKGKGMTDADITRIKQQALEGKQLPEIIKPEIMSVCFEMYKSQPLQMIASPYQTQGGTSCGPSNFCAQGDYCADIGRGWCCPQGKLVCPNGRCVTNKTECETQQPQPPTTPPYAAVTFPLTFSDGFKAISYEDAKRYCYEKAENTVLRAECRDKLGYEPPAPAPVNLPTWISHEWRFSDGSKQTSYIFDRTDSEYMSYIQQAEGLCRTIPQYKFKWKPSAGDANQSNWQNFGIPDCSGTAVSGDMCVNQYGPGWVTRERTTGNCYDSYSPSFRTSQGSLYSCSSKPASVSAPGCTTGVVAAPTPSTSSIVTTPQIYPGDENSCPGFAYSRWDSAGKRYCRLNTMQSCQYNHPAYLTQSNYKPENCPPETQTPPPSTGAGCASFTTQQNCAGNMECEWYTPPSTGSVGYCRPKVGTTTGYCGDRICGSSETSTSCPSDCGGGIMSCSSKATQGTCAETSGCMWYYPSGGGAGYCQPTGSVTPTGVGSICPTGFHWHSESGGFCINDQENYSGTCYGPSGTTVITCPSGPAGGTLGCGSLTTQSTCGATTGCMWYYPSGGGAGYCQPTGSVTPTGVGSICPTGFHWHSESGGFCINDQENYSGTCYGPSGTTVIACPRSTTSSAQCGTTTCAPGDYCANATQGWCCAQGMSICADGRCVWGATACGTTGATTGATTGTGSTCALNMFNGNVSTQNTCSYSYCPNGCTFDSTGCAASCNAATTSGGMVMSCNSNGTCESNETMSSCPSDCGGGGTYTPPPSGGGVCGNGTCESSETMSSCPSDCGGTYYTPPPSTGTCGNNICEGSESQSSCPGDCGNPPPAGGSMTCTNFASAGQGCNPSTGTCCSGGTCSNMNGPGTCQSGGAYIPITEIQLATYCDTSGGAWDHKSYKCEKPSLLSSVVNAAKKVLDILFVGRR